MVGPKNFSPLLSGAVVGSGIQDPGSEEDNNQDTRPGINIPDQQHCSIYATGFALRFYKHPTGHNDPKVLALLISASTYSIQTTKKYCVHLSGGKL
jgi:hypothetical protein